MFLPVLRSVGLFGMSALFALGCGGAGQRPITPADLSSNLTRHYDASSERCYRAIRTALVAEGYEFAVDEPNRLLTRRKTIQIPATSGTGESMGFVNEERQYEFSVEGGDSQCSIEGRSFRAWHDGRELEDVNVAYVVRNIWSPLMTSVDREMQMSTGESTGAR